MSTNLPPSPQSTPQGQIEGINSVVKPCLACGQAIHRPWCDIGYPGLNKFEKLAEKEIDDKYAEELKVIEDALKDD